MYHGIRDAHGRIRNSGSFIYIYIYIYIVDQICGVIGYS
jgi:hypothetical protein